MNIHTRLVGAFDAIILSMTAAMHLVLVFVLLDPSFASVQPAALGKHPSVIVEQLS